MRLTAIAVLGVMLLAVSANAEISKSSIRPIGNVPTGKTLMPGAAAGLLDCSGATEITLNNVYYGDNTGLISNVAAYGCNPWYEPGGEVVFHLYLSEPAMFEATIEGQGCDLDLAILNMCDEAAGCIDVVDAGFATTEPVSGDIYLVVDGYSEEGCPFILTVTGAPLPPPASFCEMAEAVVDTVFFVSSCPGGENLLSQLDCNSWPQNGLEDYYAVTMAPWSSFTATLISEQFDPAIWVLGTCTEPFQCVAFADNGGFGDPEVVTYANNSPAEITVYVVVDAYLDGTCGWYDLTFSIRPGEVSVESTTWGGIKQQFK